jgi:hypothetical protein
MQDWIRLIEKIYTDDIKVNSYKDFLDEARLKKTTNKTMGIVFTYLDICMKCQYIYESCNLYVYNRKKAYRDVIVNLNV